MKPNAFIWISGTAIAAVTSLGCLGKATPVSGARPADQARRKDTGDKAQWKLAFEEDFSDDSYRERWTLEGFADLSIERDGQTRYLKVSTKRSAANRINKQSVLWFKKPLRGDVRFVFRARGESGNKSIFYFNANPTGDSGYGSIFDWPRPDAQMARYAATVKMELYSVGILRDGKNETHCNVRYLGGQDARELVKGQMHAPILFPYDSPFTGRPDAWFEFDVRVEGRQIRMSVDGKELVAIEDAGRGKRKGTSWTPLTGGGYFGFRNFVPKIVSIDYIRAYQRIGSSKAD